MRIAFYCNLMGWPKRSAGGVRQWVLTMANALVERGHEVDVLSEAHVRTIPFENLDVILGRPIDLELGAIERKLVHEYLKDRGGVETWSEGTEPDRHLVVAPL